MTKCAQWRWQKTGGELQNIKKSHSLIKDKLEIIWIYEQHNTIMYEFCSGTKKVTIRLCSFSRKLKWKRAQFFDIKNVLKVPFYMTNEITKGPSRDVWFSFFFCLRHNSLPAWSWEEILLRFNLFRSSNNSHNSTPYIVKIGDPRSVARRNREQPKRISECTNDVFIWAPHRATHTISHAANKRAPHI